MKHDSQSAREANEVRSCAITPLLPPPLGRATLPPEAGAPPSSPTWFAANRITLPGGEVPPSSIPLPFRPAPEETAARAAREKERAARGPEEKEAAEAAAPAVPELPIVPAESPSTSAPRYTPAPLAAARTARLGKVLGASAVVASVALAALLVGMYVRREPVPQPQPEVQTGAVVACRREAAPDADEAPSTTASAAPLVSASTMSRSAPAVPAPRTPPRAPPAVARPPSTPAPSSMPPGDPPPTPAPPPSAKPSAPHRMFGTED
jgi:hypothetical protein